SDFPILTAHTSEAPPPPRQFVPSIPAQTEAAILKALAKKPEDRFQTCLEFQTALGLEPAPAADVMVALRAKPIGPVNPPPGQPANRMAPGPGSPQPRPPSPPKPAPREPQLRPRMAKLPVKEEPRRGWL